MEAITQRMCIISEIMLIECKKMKPFERCVLWVILVLIVAGAVLNRILPSWMWAPIEATSTIIGAAVAQGAVGSFTIGERSNPYPMESIKFRLEEQSNQRRRHHLCQPRLLRHSRAKPKPKKHRFTKKQKLFIASLFGGRCGICREPLPTDVGHFDIDHIRPWNLDPEKLDWPNLDNLQPLHVPCHRDKTKKENSERNSRNLY